MTMRDSRLDRKTIYSHELFKLMAAEEPFNPILL